MYARDPTQVRSDRYQELNTEYRSLIYDIPRETLFRHWGSPSGNYDLSIAGALGLIPDSGR